jgi:hypothetical protein
VVDSRHYCLWDRAGVITMPVTMDHIANDCIACHYCLCTRVCFKRKIFQNSNLCLDTLIKVGPLVCVLVLV